MGQPKIGKSSTGEPMHFSVGAVIQNKEGDFLLVDRMKPPYGFAGIAGHIDEGESIKSALYREIGEESKLQVRATALLACEEVKNNFCNRGVKIHHWTLFRCRLQDENQIAQRNPLEARSIGWYSEKQVRQMAREDRLEPVWEYWFRKLKVI